MRRAAAATLAALFALTACTAEPGGNSGDETGDSGGGAGFVTGDGTVTIVPEGDREIAPVISGPTVTGGEASTADHAGKIIVLNVWGSWCAPCRKEAPELVKASEQLGEDVAFLGLNTREKDKAPALAFERAFGIEYPSIYDGSGKLLLDFGKLPPKAIPSTLVIDEEGRIAARVLGAVDAKTLVGIVDDVKSAS